MGGGLIPVGRYRPAVGPFRAVRWVARRLPVVGQKMGQSDNGNEMSLGLYQKSGGGPQGDFI